MFAGADVFPLQFARCVPGLSKPDKSNQSRLFLSVIRPGQRWLHKVKITHFREVRLGLETHPVKTSWKRLRPKWTGSRPSRLDVATRCRAPAQSRHRQELQGKHLDVGPECPRNLGCPCGYLRAVLDGALLMYDMAEEDISGNSAILMLLYRTNRLTSVTSHYGA